MGLLATSGDTLSTVASKFPKSTGSLAIFSGLLGKHRNCDYKMHKPYQISLEGKEKEKSALSEVSEQFEHVVV